jgi:hypothetical protein
MVVDIHNFAHSQKKIDKASEHEEEVNGHRNGQEPVGLLARVILGMGEEGNEPVQLATELEMEQKELDQDSLGSPDHESKHEQVHTAPEHVVVEEPDALVEACNRLAD